MTRFVVVHFIKENSVSAVPETWLNEGKCYWPKTSLARPLIKQRTAPKSTWEQFDVKIFRDHRNKIKYFASLELAEKMAERAEETSDLSTEEDYSMLRENFAFGNHSPPTISNFVLDDGFREDIITGDGLNVTLTPLNQVEETVIRGTEQIHEQEIMTPAVIKKLSKTGGTTVGNATRRIWSLIVTDEVSNTLSWIGAHGKTKLQGFNINQVVIVAVRMIIPNATDVEILSATKVWIRKSSERLKKK
ncbi:hypothetical protein FQR65_LT17297 [Abscondita terminalis]|nr:hypothetical protein FQR65_LT17297 [Abscondita terminalis]